VEAHGVKLFTIFPTVVSMHSLGRGLTMEELACVYEQEKAQNMHNEITVNDQLLDDPRMAGLGQFVQACLDEHIASVYSPAYDTTLFVTQSWANYTEPGKQHQKHAHANSFISGVFYVQAERNCDEVIFYRPGPSQMTIDPAPGNTLNAHSWGFDVEAGQLILFPSHMEHMVPPTKSSRTRVSIAFNTFIRGTMGNRTGRTHLRLD
jgi:uncharacterized protein (TIGR02466 family)